jgi:hypothetical protein
MGGRIFSASKRRCWWRLSVNRITKDFTGAGNATDKLVAALPLAVETLRAQLTCGNPVLEVRAANQILTLNRKLIELDIKQRLDALERWQTPTVSR